VILGLVGCGHIGGSLAKAARGAATRILGADRDPGSAERARALGIVDEIAAQEDVAARADLLVLAVPVLAIPTVAAALAPSVRPGAVVTDVGSTKVSVVRGGEAAFGARFVGGHPMAGSERAGPEAADGRLFAGKRVILTPTARTDPAALATVAELWRGAGAQVVEMDPARHDRVVAAVSHLPHAVAYALCAALADQADELRGLYGGGFVDTTRIAATPASMWIDVFLDNRVAILELLDTFGAEVRVLREASAAGDADVIEARLQLARATRQRILG